MSNMTSDGRVIAPSSALGVKPFNESTAPPPVDVRVLGVRGGTGDPQGSNPLFGSVGSALSAIAPPPAAHAPRTSVMMEGNLIHRVQPVYPPLAIQARIQGSVVLRAMISREGTIENLQLISGHSILVRAAMEAVRQWRYRPYSLNREPVEVETQVTVNFVLSQR
jgi:periplasmic protein TonB